MDRLTQPTTKMKNLICILLLLASATLASALTQKTVTLQQGADGYEGVEDTWISDY